MPTPAEWTTMDEPPYGYYLYYISANVNSLNNFRLLAGRGDPLDFRAHSGQTGDPSHLISAYFLAKQICDGIQMMQNPCHILSVLLQSHSHLNVTFR